MVHQDRTCADTSCARKLSLPPFCRSSCFCGEISPRVCFFVDTTVEQRVIPWARFSFAALAFFGFGLHMLDLVFILALPSASHLGHTELCNCG